MNSPVVTVAGGKRSPWLRAPLLVAAGFVFAIALGSWLLSRDAAVVAGHVPLTWTRALFMATSATCVTGLTVVDVANGLSPFGQVVLLALIQVGGLGIMTLAFLVLLALGGETKAGGDVLQSTLGDLVSHYHPRRALTMVLGSTLALELLGALVLLPQIHEPHGLWKALFVSVSAFCNAGFDNLEHGLAPYGGHWGVCLPLMLLWLVGGLGFIVPAALLVKRQRGDSVPLDMSASMILRASALLIPLGALLFWLTERGGLLADRPANEQVLLCLFHGSTTRTAGFAALDYGQASRATLLTQIGFMLVGGAPCSTAGGMKVTAVWVFAAALWSRLLNRDQVLIGRRAVPVSAIRHATIICVFMMVAAAVLAAAVAIVEPRLPFDAVTFEVASALCTVGLSTGITPALSPDAELLLVLAMFVGRIGPLGFLYAFVRIGARRAAVRFPQSDVCVG